MKKYLDTLLGKGKYYPKGEKTKSNDAKPYGKSKDVIGRVKLNDNGTIDIEFYD